MRYKEKGFTLLEVVLALFLSTLLLQMMSTLCVNVYGNVAKLKVQMNNESQFQLASSFIQEEIKKATAVRLIVEDLDNDRSTFYIHSKKEAQGACLNKRLRSIDFERADGSIGKVKLINYRTDDKKALSKYKLCYEANGNQALIADQIEDIQVSKYEHSDEIIFSCTIAKLDAKAGYEILKQQFMVSLKDKAQLN